MFRKVFPEMVRLVEKFTLTPVLLSEFPVTASPNVLLAIVQLFNKPVELDVAKTPMEANLNKLFSIVK